MPQKVLLVDDHALVRAGIRSLLESMEGVTVTGEAGSGEEALQMARRDAPDVVITDIAMSGMGGLELTSRLRAELPAVQVVILSMHADEDYVAKSLKAGAAGYLVKDAATVELELALKAIAQGGSYLSPKISRLVVDDYTSRVEDTHPELAALTPRQREILRRLAEGQSTKQIAYDLDLSVKTVETHRAQIVERLGIRDLAGLVRLAIRCGLVSADR
jgi:DNA-binding NarL/FixJ family response regulator